jgi:hypothetical protein
LDGRRAIVNGDHSGSQLRVHAIAQLQHDLLG